MTPRGQTQTALVSIGAAVLLVVLKLGTGIATGSLALVSAGIESSGDVVAAILTLAAIRLGGRPADREHPYGHRRAENLAALGEAAILSGGGAFVVVEAIDRLGSGGDAGFDPRWYVFAVIGVALVVDMSRVFVSLRGAAEYHSAALRSNAFHFAGDMAGSVAVLFGITAVALGFQQGDAIASLVVAAIIFAAASRLIYENARVLMDTTPAEAQAHAEAAIRTLGDDIELRQLRVRESGGLYFADATIGTAPDLALVASHQVADQVEAAVRRALPDADVVVHVEPLREGLDLRARALAIALAEPPVQEAHDIAIYQLDGRCSVSMHLKLDASTPLAAAHEVAERIEAALRRESEVDDVQTHLEPLEEPLGASPASDDAVAERITTLVREQTGRPPRRLRLLITEMGLVIFLDVVASPEATLEAAHDMARRLEQEIRRNRPEGSARIVDVVVHTEP
ncbi:MAG TPA: cation diffusion facilitator family transporter [Solirubrobacterales bacterium]|jgi:cation diffusion facilitator family transporter|nr:cation diffusion facilitator family transporter [Solirubrobacterales bacterium]